MLKVVIDTNLLIDADSDEYNYCNRIIDAVISGNIQAFATHSTLRENKFIVPQKLKDQNFLRKLEYFFDSVKTVKSDRVNVVEDDHEDNKILESALASNADFVITSDKHLLKLEEYKSARIVRPAEFWNIYQDQTHDGWVAWMKSFINN